MNIINYPIDLIFALVFAEPETSNAFLVESLSNDLALENSDSDDVGICYSQTLQNPTIF
jgi:hypothetical protein